MRLEHILIPCDFSASTRAAIDYAVPLRERFPAAVTLLHVIAPFVGYGAEISIIPDNAEVNRVQSAETRLKELAAIVAGLGIYKLPVIIAPFNAPKLKREELEGQTAAERARGESQEKLLLRVEGVVAASRELQPPLRTNLIAKMGDEDVIELPSSPKPLSRNEATNKLSKSTRSKPMSHYVDHVYLIQSVNMKKSPYEVALEYGEVSFPARLILSDEDSQKLWEEFKTAHSKGTVAALPLQVTARINIKKEVVDGEVVGIGGVRENSKKLSDLLKSNSDN